MALSLRLLSLPSSLASPAAPANFPIVERFVELLCRDLGIAIPWGGVVVVVLEPEELESSTGPREMNSVFSNTHTQ